jgi:hypothetical protein
MSNFSSERTTRVLDSIRLELEEAHKLFLKTADMDHFHDVVTLLMVLQDAELRIYGLVKTKKFKGI